MSCTNRRDVKKSFQWPWQRQGEADGAASIAEVQGLMATQQRYLEEQFEKLRTELKGPKPSGQLHGEKWPLKGKFCCFISHFKREAATEARMIGQMLEAALDAPVFIDSDNLKDLNKLEGHVLESDVLVLLLTTNFLTRPWCLLEIWTAITNRVPIVAISIRGGHPYDYDDAARFLEDLDTLLEKHNPNAMQLLIDRGCSSISVAHRLSSVLPNIISTELSVMSSRNVLNAQLADVMETMHVATPCDIALTQQDWFEQRERKRRILAQAAEMHATTQPDTIIEAGPACRFAVGYSDLDATVAAVNAAFRQLRTKLSNMQPSLVIVAISEKHDVDIACAQLQELLNPVSPRSAVHKSTLCARPSPEATPMHATHTPTASSLTIRAVCSRPQGTPFIGMVVAFGLIVDGIWLNKDGYFLALQGIVDRDGVYVPI